MNPFTGTDDLVNLSTGVVASAEVRTDLLEAKEKGEIAYRSFM
jgi:hypothetical protein